MKKRGLHQNIGLGAGAVIFTFLLLYSLFPENPDASLTAAAAVLMAVWWMTEALPLPVTALIPIVFFPLSGVLSGKEIAETYFNSTILLFLGGFIIAASLEKWNVHKRIALYIISKMGGSSGTLIFSFMSASALLSMFISNTATAVMLLPVGLAIASKVEEYSSRNMKLFPAVLLLSIAYACSIGGAATLIGTPPNLVFHRIYHMTFPEAPEISFAKWMFFGLPLTVIMLLSTWILMTKVIFRNTGNIKIDKSIVKKEYKKLGKASYEEKITLLVLILAAFLWIFRADIVLGRLILPGWSNIFPDPDMIDDGTVAIFTSFLLFIIPAKSEKSRFILDETVFAGLPWGILILFGGGFALAKGFQDSGLSELIGLKLASLESLPELPLLLSLTASMTFLTEFTSNTAIANTMMPIIAGMSSAVNLNPLFLMIPAAIASSFAFMMPVATPPNAIVFGSGKIKIGDMIRAGFILNIASIIILSIFFFFYGVFIFGI